MSVAAIGDAGVAGSDYVIDKAVYANQLRRILDQGASLYYAISSDGKPSLAATENDLQEILSPGYRHIIVKHPSFSADIPHVDLVGSEDRRWYIFNSLRGDGHITIMSKKFSKISVELFYVNIGYGSFYVASDGVHIDPHRELVAMYRKFSAVLRRVCEKQNLSEQKSLMVSRKMIEEVPDWLGICRQELGVRS